MDADTDRSLLTSDTTFRVIISVAAAIKASEASVDPYTSFGNAIRLLINLNKCQTHVSFASSNWEDKNQSVHSPNRVWNHSWAEHRWAHFQNITGMENASSWLLMSSKRWLMRPSCINSEQKLNTTSNWESSFPSCLQACPTGASSELVLMGMLFC